jgi:hypothetical protein
MARFLAWDLPTYYTDGSEIEEGTVITYTVQASDSAFGTYEDLTTVSTPMVNLDDIDLSGRPHVRVVATTGNGMSSAASRSILIGVPNPPTSLRVENE